MAIPQFIYVRAPEGMPDARCFRVVEAPMPSTADGEVLVLTRYLSIDPYARRQMGGGQSRHAGSLRLGEVMIGRGAGIVIESRNPHFRVGDPVQGEFGWCEHVALDARRLRKLPADLQPLSLSIARLGQSGATALVGLVDMAGIKAGETVVVEAAPDAVVNMLSGGNIGKQMARLTAAAVMDSFEHPMGEPVACKLSCVKPTAGRKAWSSSRWTRRCPGLPRSPFASAREASAIPMC